MQQRHQKQHQQQHQQHQQQQHHQKQQHQHKHEPPPTKPSRPLYHHHHHPNAAKWLAPKARQFLVGAFTSNRQDEQPTGPPKSDQGAAVTLQDAAHN
ncbi:hypothetical protein MCOR27_001060 [Pyricularia oryzae]|nr:hypothetical protein MCOR26_001820 [Pyricularia oryzae]KAI6288035.1 hypothetical protein MCOR27_001060 [Pyricularia oryzae]KAI6356857.1 hypothetical protein MCOR32_009942 [Pyricularia oryzae]KAI6358874.1 hypothetical protein MCOR31_009681 [Pyricularia oryzae]KAI6418482.1 hypothetical protein MCOR21_010798 [Pyricularia oryzae]